MQIIWQIMHLLFSIEKKIRERTYKNGVLYIFTNNHSDKLVIVFSGIGGDYNYRRSFKDSTWDQLYIKDSWANGVSYYLFENGENYPEQLTSEFIESFLKNNMYNNVITFGSSKGGSSAIYFGLKHKVHEIYSGACQYRIGDNLGVYHEKSNRGYYQKVMGCNNPLGISTLNEHFENIIIANAHSKTVIHLIYSTAEHTYDDLIVHLIQKLDECDIKHVDQKKSFSQHSMIGNYMKEICKKKFKNEI